MDGTPPNPPAPASAKHGLPELIAERRAKGARLREADPSSFPYAYPGVEPIDGVLAAYEKLSAGDETEVKHRAAGRLAALLRHGGAALLGPLDRAGQQQPQALR